MMLAQLTQDPAAFFTLVHAALPRCARVAALSSP